MFCGKCGKEHLESATFCGKCGANVGAQKPAQMPSQNPTLNQTQNPVQVPFQPPIQNQGHNPIHRPYSPPNNQPPKKKKGGMLIGICVLLVLIISAGAVWALFLQNEDEVPASEVGIVATPAPAQPTAPTPEPGATGEDVEAVMEITNYDSFDITLLNNIISNRTNLENVSVAVLNLNTREIHITANGDSIFVAAGFYAPLYSMAIANDSTLRQTAEAMMTTMDNTSANTLIDRLGGFAEVNGLLRNLGFTGTTFARNFGDTAASGQGRENFTTAREAAQILAEIYDGGSYWRMNVDLTRDGVSLPSGVTIHAHRGLGIGDSYNVFSVIVASSAQYAVVILTDDLGQTRAVPIVSELLANIAEQIG